jgi:Domain of unknown function (DUF4388)
MTELSGTLEGMGLPAIVRFVSGLRKTGCLRITHQDWSGELVFESGQLVSATLGSRKGISALDALVQALPGASFVFDDTAHLSGEANLHLGQQELQTHLDELAERSAHGGPTLPSLDAVPRVVPQDDEAAAEETVPLDRGTLQTLLAVDGRRTVRDIISFRGSFEALWHIANLTEVGLVRLPQDEPLASAPPVREPRPPVREPRPPAREPMTPAREPMPPEASTPRPARALEPRTAAGPVTLNETVAVAVHCPKLGFEDDPNSAFGRPTRLHRCFAAGAPLPLSLDQQRELCLSDQYGTCPRLAMAGQAPGRPTTEQRPASVPAPASPSPAASQAESAPIENPRIVRLPIGGRPPSGPRIAASADTLGGVAAQPARLRPSAQTPSELADTQPPTPLRSRVSRGAGATAAVAEPDVGTPAKVELTQPAGVAARVAAATRTTPRRRLLSTVPITTLAAGAVLLIIVAVVAVLLWPRAGGLFVDDTSIDMSSLPNATAAVAGTPVSELTAAKPTAGAAADPLASAATAPASAATVATRPTTPPTAAPEPTTPPTLAPEPRTLLDETFDDNTRNWPNNPQGTAWITGGTYRIVPRQAGQFVAIGIPAVGEILQDVVINASFRKVGGPAGGGYGIIVRDQGPGPRDGTNQQGRYYVLEVGDKGEVGIWRREGDRWVDLLPWQRADAVKPGSALNELTVRAVGDRLSLSVNGTEVGTRTDSALAVGNVGIFVGGDGNQVALEQISVRTP